MDDVGRPVEFFHRFNHAAREKHTTEVVVLAENAVVVADLVLFLRKKIVVIDEVNLHPRLLNRCHLYDERVVGIVDDEVHSREADDLMQLVAALVDGAIAGHENTDFLAVFLRGLGQVSANEAHLRFRQIGGDFLMNEKYSCHVYNPV